MTLPQAYAAWGLALREADEAWLAWWESDSTLFPDTNLLIAAETAEERLHAAWLVHQRLTVSRPRGIRVILADGTEAALDGAA